MAILPYLEGERQLLYHQQIKDELEHEHAIMKDVEGWKVGERPYSSRWTPPIPRDPSKHK